MHRLIVHVSFFMISLKPRRLTVDAITISRVN